MALKAAFYTLGCKLNFSETSTVAEQFSRHGYEVVEFNNTADIYVVNTCTVTENAERECRQIVRRALRNNPEAFVAVTGCYAQLRPEEIAAIDGVDAVLGSHEKFNILEMFDDFKKKELSCIYVSPTNELNSFNSSFSTDADGRTRAFFKIQDGCDYKCTFCTIPQARGRSRSQSPDKVVEQFKQLLDEGYKEIILTGVNVGDYDFNSFTFYDLLKRLVAIDGDYRIRISSIEPNLLPDEIIDLVAENEKLCNHFHIPLQSGSPKILKLMQRRYTAEYYRGLIHKAVDQIENLGIGVDVIVGFPGETEEDFMHTYEFIKELPVSYLHVFTYSERPNTRAIEITGSVDIAERKRRNNMLRILSEKKKHEFYKRMIGTHSKVLYEADEKEGFMFGWTSNYVRVTRPFDSNLINQFHEEEIKGFDGKNSTVVETNSEILNAAG